MKWLLAVLSVGSLACVRLNEDLTYRCQIDLDCATGEVCVQSLCKTPEVDAGATDSGVTDSGTPSDSGTSDSGVDLTPCNSWACVQSGWPAPTAAATALGLRTFPLPSALDAGLYAFFGGVLLPDGRVLGIAHTADYFVVMDPAALTAETFGAQVPNVVDNQRKWAGGVLARNGKVYAFPFQHDRIIEVDPADAGHRFVGPVIDGGGYTGGALDQYGFAWTGSELAAPILRFDPASGNMAAFDSPDGGGWGGWWGAVRLPDDRVLMLPKEGFNADGRCPNPVLITPGPSLSQASFEVVTQYDARPDAGGVPLQGGALTRDGVVWSVPAGASPVAVRYLPGGQFDVIGTDAGEGYGFLGTFGDGLVWTNPDNSALTVQLWRFASDGGTQRFTTNVATPRYGYLGLVATPEGMVSIPGTATDVLLLQPGTSLPNGRYDIRPMSVLLSPYFNKL